MITRRIARHCVLPDACERALAGGACRVRPAPAGLLLMFPISDCRKPGLGEAERFGGVQNRPASRPRYSGPKVAARCPRHAGPESGRPVWTLVPTPAEPKGALRRPRQAGPKTAPRRPRSSRPLAERKGSRQVSTLVGVPPPEREAWTSACSFRGLAVHTSRANNPGSRSLGGWTRRRHTTKIPLPRRQQ